MTCDRYGGGDNRQQAHLRLPGSITRTQCTGTVPKTSGEGDLWLGMEGGSVSSLNIGLEQVDDKESFEALQGRDISGQRGFPSQRNVHKVANVASARHTNNAVRTGARTLSRPLAFEFHPSPRVDFIRAIACARHTPSTCGSAAVLLRLYRAITNTRSFFSNLSYVLEIIGEIPFMR